MTKRVGAEVTLCRKLDGLLREGVRRVALLAAATPTNLGSERARLEAALRTRGRPMPRWSYLHARVGEVGRWLGRLADEIERAAQAPIHLAYAGRARELALEAAMADAVGTPALSSLATERFRPFSAESAAAAERLAHAWIANSPEPPCPPQPPEPTPLFDRMRTEVARWRLPFRVVEHAGLGSLAATGASTIFVTAGRPSLLPEDIERTVLHEVQGHAIPRVRAARQQLGIFALGTARGTDEQEGLAIVLEHRHGFLTARRRRDLGARHLAVAWMLEGASFADVVLRLCADHGFDAHRSVQLAERAFRGSDGSRPGLGRERVYLESLLRVRRWLARRPEDEALLAGGQIALDALATVRPFFVDVGD